jgi:hypothetical protein
MIATCWLPADIKTLVTRRRHFGQINRNAAQLDTGGKTLQQPSAQHQEGRQIADRCVARHESDQYRAQRHQQQGHDQPLAAADTVDIGAQENCAQWTHQEAGAEGHESQHQRSELVAGWKEGLRYMGRIKTEQEEVEHFHEVAAGDTQHRTQPGRRRSGDRDNFVYHLFFSSAYPAGRAASHCGCARSPSG